MKLILKKYTDTTLSEQLAQQIGDRILSGLITPGEKLPSIRQLSSKLNISPVTVSKAYEILDKEQLIRRIHGKACYACYRLNDNSNTTYDSVPSSCSSIQDNILRTQFSNPARVSNLKAKYDLSNASIDPKLLPTKKILDGFFNKYNSELPELSEYGLAEGDQLFRSLASQYFQRLNIKVSADNLLVANGSQQCLYLIASTFLTNKDTVIVEEMTYPGIIDIFISLGIKVIEIPSDANGMIVENLYDLCEKYHPKMVYIVPHFNNPTGICLSHKRKRLLLDLSEDFDFLIIEDDCWSEIQFDEIERPYLKSLDTKNRVIYVKGFSKLIGPTYRLGIIVSEEPFLKKMIRSKSNMDLGSPIIIQRMLIPFFESNAIDSYIKELTKQIMKKHDIAQDALQLHAPKSIHWNRPKGGLNLIITLPERISADDVLTSIMEPNDIAFLPGSMFSQNKNNSNQLRICFSYLSDDKLYDSIHLFCDLLSEHLSSH